MPNKGGRLCLGAIACVMALPLTGCARGASPGLVLSNCTQRWDVNGRLHMSFDTKDVAAKTVVGATIYLGGPLGEANVQGADAMDPQEFERAVAVRTLPFDFHGSLQSGESKTLQLMSTFSRPPHVAPTNVRPAGCFVGSVRFADGTRWTHDVHIGFTGRRAPYFIPEKP